MKKRILSVLLGFMLTVGALPPAVFAGQGSSSDDDINFMNLVIFCKFADEEEFINNEYDGNSVVDILDNTYNKSKYSAADYFAEVSGGKLNMKTVYLFGADGSLTLSKTRGYYAEKDLQNPNGYDKGQEMLRMSELSRDWGESVNKAVENGSMPTDAQGKTYSFADLDKDGDGEIDLITIIYKNTVQNITVGHSDPLWDYETRSNAVSVTENNKTYTSGEYVQLTCQYENKNGELTLYKGGDGLTILGALGKICHETMHALGPLDLYSSSNDYKVGYMSLMGKHTSPIGQYISVKERESLGWLDDSRIKTLNGDGNYTIKQASKDLGVVAYKKDMPNNKTLYLEYRCFDENGNKYDKQDKDAVYTATGAKPPKITLKSGLICYLVDSDKKFPSNLSGRNQMDVLSHGTYDTNTDCAVGEGENIEIYNGNGWMNISVTGMNGDELSFTVTGSGAGSGNAGAEDDKLTSVTVSGDSSAIIPAEGENAAVVNLKADANYSSGKHKDVTSDAVWSVDGTYTGVAVSGGVVAIQPSAAEGSVSIKAEYNGKKDIHNITLTKDSLEKIEIKEGSRLKKSDYKWGEEFEIDGVVIEAVYKSSVRKNIPASELSYSKDLKVGQTLVSVSYKEKSCNISGISVSKAQSQALPTVSAERKYGDMSEQTVKTDVNVVPKDAGALMYRTGSVSTESGAEVSGFMVDKNGEARFTIIGGKVGDIITLPVIISSDNYEDHTVNIIVTIVEADTQPPGGSASGGSENDGNGGSSGSSGGGSGTPAGGGAGSGENVSEDTPIVDNSSLEKREWKGSFADIHENAWYFDAVKFAYEYGLMSGMSDNAFEPGKTTAREQFITVLWRLAGCPASDSPLDFYDTDENGYYAEAVRWAVENNIAGGYGNGRFGIGDEITREQLTAILYRYAKLQGGDFNESAPADMDFRDAGQISDYAREAVSWCSANGIINGDSNKYFKPKNNASRAEMAQIFANYINGKSR